MGILIMDQEVVVDQVTPVTAIINSLMSEDLMEDIVVITEVDISLQDRKEIMALVIGRMELTTSEIAYLIWKTNYSELLQKKITQA